jgi:transposase
LIIAANNQRIFYYSIKNGFFERDDFRFAIKQTADYLEKSKRFRMDNTKEYVLLTDTHKIHFDDEKSKLSKEKSINQTLRSVRMRRFFLPPGSPQLNPLESLFSTIRERLSKEKIFDQESLREKLSSLMEIIIKESTTVYFKELKIWMLKAKQG